MMEYELVELIKQKTGIDYVQWGVAPNDFAYPIINLHLVSEDGQHTMDGPDMFRKAIIQIDLWSNALYYLIMSKQEVLRLDGYSGDGTIKNIILRMVRSDQDTTDPNDILYRIMLEFDVFYTMPSDAEMEAVKDEYFNRMTSLYNG